jgi:phosphate:Na+ symporter
MDGLYVALQLLGGLGVFLYGLKVMSEGLQRAAGSRLRSLLRTMTSNRFTATLTGLLTTCVVQSSSATTVMVVAFASAGLLTLHQSLGVIFGANIGTTTTGWIVSLLGFKVQIAEIALPLIGVGFFIQFIRRWEWAQKLGDVLIGFGFLFLGLDLIKNGVPDLRDNPAAMEWLNMGDASYLLPRLAIIGVGTALTVIVQSSSAMMAITLTAASKGLIDYPTAVALVLGENIGTTITANLAAIGAPGVAKQAARGHFLFNVLGVIWAGLLFVPFVALVDLLVPGDPLNPAHEGVIPVHIAGFHTAFNVINTGVMLAFINPLARLVRWIQPDEVERHDLRFLDSALAGTAELGVAAARQEAAHMASVVVSSIRSVGKAVHASDEELPAIEDAIFADENHTDRLERAITDYLTDLVRGDLSAEASTEVLGLLDMANELERMADHSEKLVKLLRRSRSEELALSAPAVAALDQMAAACVVIAEGMHESLLDPDPARVPLCKARENELDRMRADHRHAHNLRLASGECSAAAGILFADLLSSFERFGDHAMKVVYLAVGQREART